MRENKLFIIYLILIKSNVMVYYWLKNCTFGPQLSQTCDFGLNFHNNTFGPHNFHTLDFGLLTFIITLLAPQFSYICYFGPPTKWMHVASDAHTTSTCLVTWTIMPRYHTWETILCGMWVTCHMCVDLVKISAELSFCKMR
jgi:hypothetical protein